MINRKLAGLFVYSAEFIHKKMLSSLAQIKNILNLRPGLPLLSRLTMGKLTPKDFFCFKVLTTDSKLGTLPGTVYKCVMCYVLSKLEGQGISRAI